MNHCWRHAVGLGYKPVGQKRFRLPAAAEHELTAPAEGQQRRRVCSESGCPRRARASVGGVGLCKAHAHWRQRLQAYVSFLSCSPHGRPPPSTSSLASWMGRQQICGFVGKLAKSQASLLRDIPKWQRSLRSYASQRYHEEAAAARGSYDMANEDLDADSAAWRGHVLRRDADLLAQTHRDDAVGTAAAAGFNYYLERGLKRICSASGQMKPVIFKLPGMLGCEFPPVPTMASNFTRDAEEPICHASCKIGQSLGKEEVAYHGISVQEDLFCRVPMKPRPCTFARFAELAPAKSIHLWHYSKSGGHVLGQQSNYVKFLDSIEFVGRVWLPSLQHERHLETSVDQFHVHFATTARTHAQHLAACQRHDCCLCGLSAADAKKALRVKGELCYEWRSGACICQPSRDEALRRLYPAVNVLFLETHVVLHLATALGWQPDESQRQLCLHARAYIILEMAAHVWGPQAIETCRSDVQLYWEDSSCQRLCKLGQIVGVTQAAQESGLDFVNRVLDRTAALQATFGAACPCLDELFVPTHGSP